MRKGQTRSLWKVICSAWCFHVWHKSDEPRVIARCCEREEQYLWVCCKCLKRTWTAIDPRWRPTFIYLPLPPAPPWPPRVERGSEP